MCSQREWGESERKLLQRHVENLGGITSWKANEYIVFRRKSEVSIDTSRDASNVKNQKGTVNFYFQELKANEFRPTSFW